MKKILLVWLAGVAVGILLAPEKGSITRKKLAKGLKDTKDKAMDEIDSLVDQKNRLAAKAKEQTQTVVQEW